MYDMLICVQIYFKNLAHMVIIEFEKSKDVHPTSQRPKSCWFSIQMSENQDGHWHSYSPEQAGS